MMKALSKAEAVTYCSEHLSDWTVTDKAIRRDFVFRNFVEAFSFMAAVALEAEKMDHHPDWSNGYNRVSIELSTHSEGGVTGNDLELAGKIDKIYGNFRK